MSRLGVFAKHNLSTGTANESILRDFLSRHAPGYIDVGEGFIVDLFGKRDPSKQCDILIFDRHHYPTVYADGPIKVVLPEAVRMVIEVKTVLEKKDVPSAIDNIAAAVSLEPHAWDITGVIFAFGSCTYTSLRKYLKELKVPSNAPRAILLMERGIIIYNYDWLVYKDAPAATLQNPWFAYAARRSKNDDNKRGIVVAFLLLVFFHAIKAEGLLISTSTQTMIALLEEYTELLDKEIYIGQSLHEETS